MIFGSAFKKIFGSRNQRIIKKYSRIVNIINNFEDKFNDLSDQALANKTIEFKQRLANNESLEHILPEAFAVVREAAKRTLNMRHFDVQLIGGMALNDGNIAEMHTGEGKTLVATLPAYLNALTGKSVHIVTVNDYLAKRDANWMRPVYEFLGLKVGIVVPNMSHEEKKENYNSDIVYGTNNEFGFDYLRDNMAFSLDERVQKDKYMAIVDEVDSILIDEARTPLIISGPAETSSDMYIKLNKIVPLLIRQYKEEKKEGNLLSKVVGAEEFSNTVNTNSEQANIDGDFIVDEKNKQVFLTELGHENLEKILVDKKIIEANDSLYNPANIAILHHLNAALRAHCLFNKDVDYIVANNEIIIVDEHTGRTMQGRRWSDGLHQAIEAKEGVEIKQENQTLASITFQNYFRLYEKLAGMTGTADTEAFEFHQIYNLEVIVIPTNKKVVRLDQADQIFLTVQEKFNAIVEDVKVRRDKGQPILLGTASIEASEILSKLLKKNKIPHQVLNAKFHAKEAEIISEAGRPGVVTIATNMAGRGTDIVLGGNFESELAKLDNPSDEKIASLKQDWEDRHKQVIKAGGLYVLGSERHESRRIDNQLRGRSGRQGDPGETRFYLSMDDNLMRIFASDRMKNVMARLGMSGHAIESGMITRSIESAQRKVEGLHFEIRKNLLEYDDIANEQRKIIYEQRDYLITESNVHNTVVSIMQSVLRDTVFNYMPLDSLEEQWDIETLEQELRSKFHVEININKILDQDNSIGPNEIAEKLVKDVIGRYEEKQVNFDKSVIDQIERNVLLQILDNQWREHLVAMDHLRQSVGLRGYAQKDPKQEYKKEAFHLFESLLDNYQVEITSVLSHYKMFSDELLGQLEENKKEQAERERQQMQMQHQQAQSIYNNSDDSGNNSSADVISLQDSKHTPVRREHPKIGRNDKCFCGSGNKYKHCHGKLSNNN